MAKRPGDARSGARRALALAALTLFYFLAGKLGLELAFVHASATAVWPPTGIALAACLVWGYGVWPAILLGAFLVNLTNAGSVTTSLGIAVGNTLEGLVGAFLVNRFARGLEAFQRPKDVFKFAALAGILSTTVSATCGLASLSLGGLAAWDGTIWLTWWLGDAVGALVVGPALILWSIDRRWGWRGWRLIELLLLLAMLGFAGLAVFTHAFHSRDYPLQVLTVPMLLWAGFRFGPREAATSILGLSVIAIWGTVRGVGPFAREYQNESLLLLQVFLGIWAITALALAAAVAERKVADDKVRRLNEELERRVRDRTSQLEQANQTLSSEVEFRRRTEEQLQGSEGRLLEAQQLAHIGNWEWRIDRDDLAWSAELHRIYGLEPGSFRAGYEGFLERVHPEDRARVDEAVRRSLEQRQPFAFEHRIVRPDGAIRTLYGRGRVVLDAEGKPVRMLGIGQDITERKQAEEERAQLIGEQAARREAEEASRLKDEFLATLSHELRTPLNAIVGWGHLLKEGALESADARKAIAAIGRNAQALTRLIADLLDISRAVSGRLALDLSPTDPRAVIQSAVETLQQDADAKSVRIELTLAASAPVIQADPERLEQVVRNLLANAIKFSPVAGRVRVSLTRALDRKLEIRVEDEGPGIAAAFLPHVFERFRLADASTTRRHGGLGLGLAIVRNLVDLHGGSVSASNRTDGSGAIFSVRLPQPDGSAAAVAAAEQGSRAEAGSAVPAAAVSLQGVRVLVIDDEADGRAAVVAVLQRSGAEALAAGSAAEGLSALESFRPHVVLSDIQMPEEDGYVFLRRLRALPPERGGLTPAAALTAHAGPQERALALEAGFQRHISKPVDPAELLTAIATLASAAPALPG